MSLRTRVAKSPAASLGLRALNRLQHEETHDASVVGVFRGDRQLTAVPAAHELIAADSKCRANLLIEESAARIRRRDAGLSGMANCGYRSAKLHRRMGSGE